MDDVDLTVIVVSWNTVHLLDDCLRSIVAHAPRGVRQEIVVVDNGSSDGSADHLRARWPSVRLLENDANVGFCRANNQAIRAALAPNLLLVNTDARLGPGCAETLLGYLQRDERAAVVGPRLTYADGRFQRWTAGRLPSLSSCAAYLLGADRLGARLPALGGLYLHDDVGAAFMPGWVSSAVMLLRRKAVEEVGLFDESIFVYMDDVDLCERLTDAGWHVWYAPDAAAVHFMGGSAPAGGTASPEAVRSLARWFERRHGPAAALVLRALGCLGFGARAGVCTFGGILRTDEAAMRRGRDHWVRAKSCVERSHA